MSLHSIARLALYGALVAAAAPSHAQDDKQIRVRTETPATPASDIVLDVRQTKQSFKVNEAIRLRARVNKEAYVYVYTKDSDSKYLTLLYPARATDPNKLKRFQWTVIPPKQVFYGDEAGSEKIFVVASLKPIDMSARYFTEAGQFLRAPTAQMTAAFADKGIRLRDEAPVADKDQSQKVVSVKIVP